MHQAVGKDKVSQRNNTILPLPILISPSPLLSRQQAKQSGLLKQQATRLISIYFYVLNRPGVFRGKSIR